MRTTLPLLVLAFIASISVGCADNSSTASSKALHARASSNKGGAVADDSKTPFDTGDQPAVTADTRFAAGQLSEVQGDLPNAIKQYQEALKLDPNHLGSLYRLGVDYAQIRQYSQAIDCWQQYVKATHNAAPAFGDLGFCYELSGDSVQAEIAYKKGIAADPKNVACHVNYGIMLARQGHISDATVQFQAVLTPAEIHYNIGSVYEMQGRREEARQQYDLALKLNPKLQEAKDRVAALDLQ